MAFQKQWPWKPVFNCESQVSEREKILLNSKDFPSNNVGKVTRALSLQSRWILEKLSGSFLPDRREIERLSKLGRGGRGGLMRYGREGPEDDGLWERERERKQNEAALIWEGCRGSEILSKNLGSDRIVFLMCSSRSASSVENLTEFQIFGPHPRHTESGLLGWTQRLIC